MTRMGEVQAALGVEGRGDLEIHGVSSSSSPRPETLSFLTRWSEAAARIVAANPRTVFLVPADAETAAPNVIPTARPRLAYAQVLREVLTSDEVATIAPTAFVDPAAEIGSGVTIGHFAVVEAGVVVGDGVHLDHHVVLKSGVVVGARSRVGNHTAIGGAGFGFEVDDDGKPLRIGHRGGVVIGDDVEIGQHCSIAQGTIEPTRIASHVKIDDCVFIAHNVQVGEAAFIIACSEISGSVRIGARAWVSPAVAVINKVDIGDDALVGIGAVVVKDVDANTIVAGVPAKPRGPRYP
jgi:UDP-3-O-[3-hydroxymyristoyl] glucosamine N-acyltransferase